MRHSDGDSTPSFLNDANSIRAIGHLTTALDSLPDIAFIVNPEPRVVFVNQACANGLALAPASAIGMHPGELIGCESTAEARGEVDPDTTLEDCEITQIVEEAVRTGSADGFTQAVLPHGQVPDLAVRARTITEPQERPLVLCMANDRSEALLQDQLDRYFYHDLLNITAGIAGLADLIASGLAENEDVATLGQLTSDLTAMIQDQRVLKTAAAGGLEIVTEQIRVGAVIDNTLRPNALLAGERSVEINRVGDDDLVVVTDLHAAARVLTNLLKNAIEASQPGDTVTIATASTPDRVEISIHNRGPIAEDLRNLIFERPLTTKGPGHGLGSFAAKLLTERYLGGSIWFTTDSESGTTFTVSLPGSDVRRGTTDSEHD